MTIKGVNMIQLEISKDEDKATVAAILVMNGYTVRKATIKMEDGWHRVVIQAKKEQEK
jgi:glutamate-1-semialdehyde aminotransferase